MAQKLDIKVLAEGIDDTRTLNLLLEMGCDYGQGYYLSKPLSIEDFVYYAQRSV